MHRASGDGSARPALTLTPTTTALLMGGRRRVGMARHGGARATGTHAASCEVCVSVCV